MAQDRKVISSEEAVRLEQEHEAAQKVEDQHFALKKAVKTRVLELRVIQLSNFKNNAPLSSNDNYEIRRGMNLVNNETFDSAKFQKFLSDTDAVVRSHKQIPFAFEMIKNGDAELINAESAYIPKYREEERINDIKREAREKYINDTKKAYRIAHNMKPTENVSIFNIGSIPLYGNDGKPLYQKDGQPMYEGKDGSPPPKQRMVAEGGSQTEFYNEVPARLFVEEAEQAELKKFSEYKPTKIIVPKPESLQTYLDHLKEQREQEAKTPKWHVETKKIDDKPDPKSKEEAIKMLENYQKSFKVFRSTSASKKSKQLANTSIKRLNKGTFTKSDVIEELERLQRANKEQGGAKDFEVELQHKITALDYPRLSAIQVLQDPEVFYCLSEKGKGLLTTLKNSPKGDACEENQKQLKSLMIALPKNLEARRKLQDHLIRVADVKQLEEKHGESHQKEKQQHLGRPKR